MSLLGAAVGALGSVLGFGMSSRSARRAQQSQERLAHEQMLRNEALQREFAQNSIQWRVADAKAAGLHPLYALGGSGASFSPSPIRVGGSSSDPGWLSLGNSLGQLGGAVANYYSREASSELYGPPSDLATDHAAYSYAIPDRSPAEFTELPGYWRKPDEYGMVSPVEKPSMAYWAVPGVGRVIAPEATNFSESLEGLESPMGQALVLYLNRDLGMEALKWLWGQMPSIGKSLPSLLDMGVELARSYAEKRGVEIRRN